MTVGSLSFVRRMRDKFVFATTRDSHKVAEYWRRRGVVIGDGTHIGKSVRFGNGGRDPIDIGRNCVLTGCTILGHDASTNRALGLGPGDRSPTRPVCIEDDCFIGLGAIVLMGTTIGRGSIVGAGTVVSRDVPPGSVFVGNPGRVVGSVDDLVARRLQLAREHPEWLPKTPRAG